ncbi:hypothetical protein JW964_16220 [candidate division KSB1 bacterium]|nr:hypothetical protein [candidate division KSB1 bacterium]
MSSSKFVIAFILFFIFDNILFSQDVNEFKKYEKEIEQGRPDQLGAIQIKLEKLLKTPPVLPDIYYLLGRIQLKLKNWGKAKDWFDKELEADPQRIRPHYYLGIGDREDGIAKVPLRIFLWRNAAKHFRKVIETDSSYQYVLLEFAWLKRYQENFDEAVDLALKQLRLNSGDRPQQEIFLLYDAFIENAGSSTLNPFKGGDDFVEKWLKARHSIYDRYFLGEHWRRMGKFDAADSILNLVLSEDSPICKIPIYLSLVRLHYQKSEPEIAEKFYWEAVERIESLLDYHFFENDLYYIYNDVLLARKIHDVETARLFIKTFWRVKDPFPASAHNSRLAEHYRRLVFAEQNYRYDGFRLMSNNPDRESVLKFPKISEENRILNDKGLVYIRFGPPDDTATEITEMSIQNESWLYYQRGPQPKMIFHFEVVGGPGCWRLVPMLSNRQAYNSRLGWDSKLNRYYIADDQLEIFQLALEMREESRKQVSWALENDRHSWNQPIEILPLMTYAARFLGDSSKFRTDISYSLPLTSLFKTPADSQSITLESAVGIYDFVWQEIDRKYEILSLNKKKTTEFIYDQQLIKKYQFEFSMPKVHVANHVREVNGNRMNGVKFDLDFERFTKDTLTCSDIDLAYNIQPTTKNSQFTHRDLEIISNPSGKFSRQKPVFIYFEIYHLKPAPNGLKRYEIEYIANATPKNSNIFKSFIKLFGKKSPRKIAIKDMRENESSDVNEHLALDFSNFEPSHVELTIIIQDKISSQICEAKTKFDLE